MVKFQINDPSLESQWRAIILFGKNSATYKFAFAKALLELVEKERTAITLSDLAEPFSRHVVDHLRQNDKQGNASSSKFLEACRSYINGQTTKEELLVQTERLGFVNVVDAFQVVNRDTVPNPFYQKNYINSKKEIIITDNLLRLKESFHFQNFGQETEARWKLVETAWNLNINPNLLEVQYDEDKELFFLENSLMRRVDITSVRDSLNGYQKGKCFYSFQDISVNSLSPNLCEVDHFLPHVNKPHHLPANLNGVWNLVLADNKVNGNKLARVPEVKYLLRLYNRNEFFIESKHPLSETIVNQTGDTPEKRRRFLEFHYNIALQNSIHTWRPEIELPSTF
ncbi:HNH endonuclease domain-containing protein [Pontibacter chinhatensis]|uniref:HNH endonuclease n=1 Tax=Pontibacter chinhatensis TaxID=1436961 RepID=A0A1I2ZTK7_9BACT|nr:HNH endonuclease domain-containing protein [Pontibacter chinhatensis]SFH40965.1 HNH endonuclease [Pontibacter chinhatensis]